MNAISATYKNYTRWGILFLLLGIAVFLLWGAGAQRAQETLAGQVVRLHVIANSNTQEDQALKLQVRDRVLEELGALLGAESDAGRAQETITAALGSLGAAGMQEAHLRGYDYPVTASLGSYHFPTKDYGGFALPEGDYTALRVVIGDGEGENWWCVVFPPLCMEAVSDSDAVAALGLDDGSAALITPDGDGEYQLRFRSVELWEKLKALFPQQP